MKSDNAKSLIAVGLILIILGVALGFVAKGIDFDTITQSVSSVAEDVGEATGGNTKAEEPTTQSAAAEAVSGVVDSASTAAAETGEQAVDTINTVKDKTGITKAQKFYESFCDKMEKLEKSIANIDNLFLVAILILAVFLSKCFISFVPINVTCALSGFIFPIPVALLINALGISFILFYKYYKGGKKEKNSIHKIMTKFPTIEKLVEGNMFGSDQGNPLVLFVLRLIPVVPINPISQLYGFMKYPWAKYLAISLVGYSFKLVSFTVLGKGIHDPFHSGYFVFFAVILIIAGLAMIGLAVFLDRSKKEDQKERAELKHHLEEELI